MLSPSKEVTTGSEGSKDVKTAMKTKYTTFYRTILDSPQWQAWVAYNERDPLFDVHESMETGWMSQTHFQAFLAFCVLYHEQKTIMLKSIT
jgi:hypothetical protein